MKFGKTLGPIGKTNPADPLPFAPAASTIPLSQPRYLADTRTDRERLDVRDFADDGEMHQPMLTTLSEFAH